MSSNWECPSCGGTRTKRRLGSSNAPHWFRTMGQVRTPVGIALSWARMPYDAVSNSYTACASCGERASAGQSTYWRDRIASALLSQDNAYIAPDLGPLQRKSRTIDGPERDSLVGGLKLWNGYMYFSVNAIHYRPHTGRGAFSRRFTYTYQELSQQGYEVVHKRGDVWLKIGTRQTGIYGTSSAYACRVVFNDILRSLGLRTP